MCVIETEAQAYLLINYIKLRAGFSIQSLVFPKHSQAWAPIQGITFLETT